MRIRRIGADERSCPTAQPPCRAGHCSIVRAPRSIHSSSEGIEDSGGSNVEHRPGNRGELKFRDAFYLHHGLKGGGRDGIEDILRPRDRRGRSHEIR
jgi:hypothetical protein